MLYLECYPDEALVHTLGVPRKQIDHSKGKMNVCNNLRKTKNAFGMIDEDPGKLQHLDQKEWKLVSEKHQIKFFKDTKRNHFIICLCPDLENWIFKVAQKEGLKLARFGLPDDAKKLHEVINSRIRQFENLIEFLVEQENKPILHLKELLNP